MSTTPDPFKLIFANGEMADLIRAYDWSTTSLGPIADWPAPLLVQVNQILDSSFPMFIWWGKDKLQFYNDAYLRILGTDADSKHPKALGQQGADCWPEIWEMIAPLLDSVLESVKPVYLEDQLIPIYRQGRLDNVYWTFSYNLIRETDGSAGGILVICSETTQKVRFQQDVSSANEELEATNEELQAANEELGQSREDLIAVNYLLEERVNERTIKWQDARNATEAQRQRLASIVAKVPAGLALLTGREMKLELANEYMLGLWDRDERSVGKPLLEFLPELREQAFPALLDNVFTSGQAFMTKDAPVTLIRGGKTEQVFMDFSYTPLAGTSGETDSILVLAEDVTSRTLTRNREQQMAEEVTAINEEMNAANEELRATNEELAAAQLKVEANAERFRFILDAIPQQVWTAKPNGGLNYVNQNVSREFGRSGEEIVGDGWQAFIHPDDLANAIAAWTNALATAAVYQVEFRLKFKDGEYYWHLARALPMIENGAVQLWLGSNTNIDLQKRNEQRKDEFLSIASHELKTPLTSIKAFNQLMKRASDPAKLESFIAKSTQHIQRLERLISDLLDVTKINAGKMNYDLQPFDFRQMLTESIESVQHTAPGHRLLLLSECTVDYTGDRFRLEQVVNNFLNNAVKYSPEGKEVWVNCTLEAESILVSVQDFGIGIAQESLDKLFDRYYRVDNTAMRFEGLGLGLYISSEILKRHNGTFWIESKLGEGSVFNFRLPLKAESGGGSVIDSATEYQDDKISIVYNESLDRLDVDWKGYQTLASVQHGGMMMLDKLRRNQCQKVLNDNRHVLGTWSDAADWAGTVWFPMMEQAGLKYFAWVFSSSAFSQLSAKKSVNVMQGNVTVQFFTEIGDAETWIDEL